MAITLSCISQTPVDVDGDGLKNGIDLDDDNDGIPDELEDECAVFVTNADAFWPYNGNTGDVSGNGNHAVTIGEPGYSVDKVEGGFSGSFPGTLSIQYSVSSALMSRSFTRSSFSAWIKPNNLSGNRIIYEEGGATHGAMLWISNGVLTYSVAENGNRTNLTHPTMLTVDNEWHHVACTFDNGITTVYLDGVSSAGNILPATVIPNHGDPGGIGGVVGSSTAVFGITSNAFFSGGLDAARYSNTEAWSSQQIQIEFNSASCDKDKDGIIDRYDLDSDNDGIPDIVEAGGEDVNGDGRVDDIIGNMLLNDSDSDGLDDRYDADNGGISIRNLDTDRDSIINVRDLDSDNDGIPDVVEAGGTDVNGNGIADDFVDTDGDGFNDVVDGDVGNDGVSENVNAFILTGEDSNYDGIPDTYPMGDNDGDGVLNQLDLDADDDGVPDVVEVGGTDVNGDGRADNYTDSDGDGFQDILDGDPDETLPFGFGADGPGKNTANALVLTGADIDGDGVPNSKPEDDFDGDGVYNFLDLDSDDDGILDVTEALGSDVDRDGKQDGSTDTDQDGYNDSVDGDTDNSLLIGDDSVEADATNSLTLTDVDSDTNGAPDDYPNDDFDNDGKLNYQDIDSDNDGVVDNTEGQPSHVSDGYIYPANSDADGDGIDDAYDNNDSEFGGSGSSFVIVDSDTDLAPDYLDTDADDDGDIDALEAHDTDNDDAADSGSPANTGLPGGTTDIDNDGLLDGYDNNTSSTDPTNGGLLGASHPNIDPGTSERDWRERPDHDSDGIPDVTDIDDDNDGILDTDEGFCPTFVTQVDAFWTFEGNTNDVSGNARHQQDGQVLAYSTDRVQGQFSANFNLAAVQYSDGSFFQDAFTQLSFSAWIKPSFLTFNRVIFEEGGDINGATLWINSGVLTFSTRNSGGVTNLAHSTPLTLDGNWHHVACTYNNGVMKVYLDGIPQSRTTFPFTTSVPFHGDDGGLGGQVGNSTAAGVAGFFRGLIDAAKYSNTVAWTDAEILSEVATSDCDGDGDGVVNQFDLDSDNDGIADIIEAGGVDVNEDGRVDVTTDANADGWADLFDGDNGGTALPDGDQDQDAVPNRLDLDADGDGVTDIIEVGGVDADQDGRVDNFVDTDMDGWANTFDSDNGGVAVSILNTDGGWLPNYLDIDSDSDGLTDNFEAQGTAVFVNSSRTDTDADGWDDRYDGDVQSGVNGTPITLNDHDGDGDADYIDFDTDGDGLSDWTEGFDDDGDEDALFDYILRADNYETTAGNPLKYVTIQDTDGDDIPDFLEDADSDNIPNFLDPDNATYYFDTDNDGLVDLFDEDNSGASSNNPDGDSDGEYDFRDPDNLISLPIGLVEFKAIREENKVRLNWSTSSEINNDFFTIERSIDGRTFDTILTQQGAGNSADLVNYLRYDDRPSIGHNYYRLSQTDYNGKSETFNIEVVLFTMDKLGSSYKLYPNPNNGKSCYLEFTHAQLGQYQLEVLAASGKLLKRRTINIDKEEMNHRYDLLEGRGLSYGIYYLRIISDQNTVVLKFIVK